MGTLFVADAPHQHTGPALVLLHGQVLATNAVRQWWERMSHEERAETHPLLALGMRCFLVSTLYGCDTCVVLRSIASSRHDLHPVVQASHMQSVRLDSSGSGLRCCVRDTWKLPAAQHPVALVRVGDSVPKLLVGSPEGVSAAERAQMEQMALNDNWGMPQPGAANLEDYYTGASPNHVPGLSCMPQIVLSNVVCFLSCGEM